MTILKKLIKRLFPFLNHIRFSYGQEGEDLILASFFEGLKKSDGFYIDVGALDPYRFSNTQYFYRFGWKGINIEPNLFQYKKFLHTRKRDINLNLGVSIDEGVLDYYMFDEPAVNTFDENQANELIKNSNYKLIEKKNIQVTTLSSVFDQYLDPNQNIDFMSVDVEGFDLEVLKSNNWEKYRPTILAIEDHNIDLNNLSQSATYEFLASQGYELKCKTIRTCFYKVNKRN